MQLAVSGNSYKLCRQTTVELEIKTDVARTWLKTHFTEKFLEVGRMFPTQPPCYAMTDIA